MVDSEHAHSETGSAWLVAIVSLVCANIAFGGLVIGMALRGRVPTYGHGRPTAAGWTLFGGYVSVMVGLAALGALAGWFAMRRLRAIDGPVQPYKYARMGAGVGLVVLVCGAFPIGRQLHAFATAPGPGLIELTDAEVEAVLAAGDVAQKREALHVLDWRHGPGITADHLECLDDPSAEVRAKFIAIAWRDLAPADALRMAVAKRLAVEGDVEVLEAIRGAFRIWDHPDAPERELLITALEKNPVPGAAVVIGYRLTTATHTDSLIARLEGLRTDESRHATLREEADRLLGLYHQRTRDARRTGR